MKAFSWDFWKLQAVVMFSISEKPKFEIDTTHIILSYLYHFENWIIYMLFGSKLFPRDKINKFKSFKFLLWKTLEDSEI